MSRINEDPNEETYFLGHYVPWREVRLKVLIDYYGREWFKEKRILELGCGYGHIGINFAMLGADVTFSDGRQKHLDEIGAVWPVIPPERLIIANMEDEWPFEGHWDLILHQGLLYHLAKWQFSLYEASLCCDHLVLESEVLDSDDRKATKKVNEDPDKMHSSINGLSIRVPQVAIEESLSAFGFRHKLCEDSRLNSSRHNYTWSIENTGRSFAQTRRWWWCWRGEDGTS